MFHAAASRDKGASAEKGKAEKEKGEEDKGEGPWGACSIHRGQICHVSVDILSIVRGDFGWTI